MCCKRLAKNAGQTKNRQKFAVWAPSHKFVGLNLRNEGTYRQSKKNLLSSNIYSTCPHNMVNFGPLAAEIVSLVWGTPGNFNGFRVFGSVTARQSSKKKKNLLSSNMSSTSPHNMANFGRLVLLYLWSPYVIGQTIIFLPCDFYLSLCRPM